MVGLSSLLLNGLSNAGVRSYCPECSSTAEAFVRRCCTRHCAVGAATAGRRWVDLRRRRARDGVGRGGIVDLERSVLYREEGGDLKGSRDSERALVFALASPANYSAA